MSEPAATEADAYEQQMPVLDPDEGSDDDVAEGVATATDAVPLESDEADRAEQAAPVPMDEDDYR